uniref:G-protein coupled receptors family 1 profile domain-containing protein n=1 Tax=Biomphalaria glabrata TaxID=6526 RepID=A0A2C9LHN1_BIOGL
MVAETTPTDILIDTVDPIDNDLELDRALSAVDLIFSSVLIHVFSLVGLVGNSINILILSRYNITTDSSNILLVSLSVSDFLFCFSAPISHSTSILSRLMPTLPYLKLDKLIFQNFELFGRIAYCTSITLVGVISLERFVVVYFPFRASEIVTPFRVKVAAFVVYVINIALFSPLFNMFKMEMQYVEDYDDYLPVMLPTDFYVNNYKTITLTLGVFYNNVILGSSILVTLILTPATAIKLWFIIGTRSQLTSQRCRFEPQVAKILVTVCTINLIIYAPFVAYDSALNLMSGYSLDSNSFRLYLIITDFSGTISASVNFLVYVTMSKKFRNSYK